MFDRVYSVLDMKLGAFSKPFFVATDAVAVRCFSDVALDFNTDIGKHPEDYCLYYLGSFDSEKGVFFDLEKRSLATASEFMKVEK